MKIRTMKVSDIEAVAALEADCFANPWKERDLYRDFTQNSESRFYVAVENNSIVAHIGLWKREDHIHITTIAVSSTYRRRGIGSQLIKHIQEKFPKKDIVLEVRESNIPAQAFYANIGFQVSGRRPHYYSNNGEDALVMLFHPNTDINNADEHLREHQTNA